MKGAEIYPEKFIMEIVIIFVPYISIFRIQIEIQMFILNLAEMHYLTEETEYHCHHYCASFYWLLIVCFDKSCFNAVLKDIHMINSISWSLFSFLFIWHLYFVFNSSLQKTIQYIFSKWVLIRDIKISSWNI